MINSEMIVQKECFMIVWRLARNISKRLRLRLFQMIPDKTVISYQYRKRIGQPIDWKNPRRFTEKVQLYKLYYKNPLLVTCSDKADVRGFVADRGLSEILNEVYGVYDSLDEIDFDTLPDQFVVKDTLGEGSGIGVIVCADKNKLDLPKMKKRIRSWLRIPCHLPYGGREWPYYSGKKHRIIIERYIDAGPEGPIDYKFFCFDGVPKYMYVISDRWGDGGPRLGFFDADFTQLPFRYKGMRELAGPVAKPENFELMLDVARRLSAPFPQVRVDLYNDHGKVVFGELTFYSGQGYSVYEPNTFDYMMGEAFHLPESCMRECR